jgi:hypothetical protein
MVMSNYFIALVKSVMHIQLLESVMLPSLIIFSIP